VNHEVSHGNLDKMLRSKVLRAEPNNNRQIKVLDAAMDKLDQVTHLAVHGLSFFSVQCLDSEASGSHGGEYKDGCLLGCCAV
jgi:hypothetical protein